MIRYRLFEGMRVLFVGINPHYGSFRRGVPFSNNKTFWYLLRRSGAIGEDLDELKDDAKLRTMYEKRFGRVYRFGFLNIVDRPSRDISALGRGEELPGSRRLIAAIKKYRPNVVCFIGKVTFSKFSGQKSVHTGWQQRLFDSEVFVMHFPIRGKASVRIKELKIVLSKADNGTR